MWGMSPPEAETMAENNINDNHSTLSILQWVDLYDYCMSIDSKTNGVQTGVSDYSVKHDCNLKELLYAPRTRHHGRTAPQVNPDTF